LRRVSRDGRAGSSAGVLEDYGDVAYGLLALHSVTGAARWLRAAGALLETVLTHFADHDGTLFDTADFATDEALAMIRRPKEPTDGAYPSGTSAAAAALLGYARPPVHQTSTLRCRPWRWRRPWPQGHRGPSGGRWRRSRRCWMVPGR
jgi:uncharacterized protein YyaL (SSP411 family)